MENTQFTQSDVYGSKGAEEAPEAPVVVRQPVVVELTSKKYKLWMLIGVLMVIGSIVGAFVTLTSSQPLSAVLMAYPFFGGFAIFAIAKFLAWWNNG